jgi:hypothetical protein
MRCPGLDLIRSNFLSTPPAPSPLPSLIPLPTTFPCSLPASAISYLLRSSLCLLFPYLPYSVFSLGCGVNHDAMPAAPPTFKSVATSQGCKWKNLAARTQLHSPPLPSPAKFPTGTPFRCVPAHLHPCPVATRGGQGQLPPGRQKSWRRHCPCR